MPLVADGKNLAGAVRRFVATYDRSDRFDPLATPSRNDCYLRRAVIADRSRRGGNWGDSGHSRPSSSARFPVQCRAGNVHAAAECDD